MDIFSFAAHKHSSYGLRTIHPSFVIEVVGLLFVLLFFLTNLPALSVVRFMKSLAGEGFKRKSSAAETGHRPPPSHHVSPFEFHYAPFSSEVVLLQVVLIDFAYLGVCFP